MRIRQLLASAVVSESLPSSAPARRGGNLCGSQRLCVIFFFVPSSDANRRLPAALRCGSHRRASHTASCNKLQLYEFLGSVDFRGLKWHLSPFRINTSKNYRTFRIALIANKFNSPRINTSTNLHSKSPRINTSKKEAGGYPL